MSNTNQPVDVMVQTGHLFAPMPEVIRDDMAFLDRIHFYLPGWEIPKMRNDLFTDHYGFVIDYASPWITVPSGPLSRSRIGVIYRKSVRTSSSTSTQSSTATPKLPPSRRWD